MEFIIIVIIMIPVCLSDLSISHLLSTPEAPRYLLNTLLFWVPDLRGVRIWKYPSKTIFC